MKPNNSAPCYLGPKKYFIWLIVVLWRKICNSLITHAHTYIPSPLTYSDILTYLTRTHTHTHALCTHEAKNRNVYDFLKSNTTWVVPLSDKICWPIIFGHSPGQAGANVGLVPHSAMPLTSPDPASRGQKGIPTWAHVPGTQLWYQIQNNRTE